MTMKKKIDKAAKKQVAAQLDLVEKFLLDMIEHPEKLEKLPDHGTLVLYPILVERPQAA